MGSVTHGSNLHGFAAEYQTETKAKDNGAATSSAAADTGPSAPDESDGYDATPPGCNCGEYHYTLSDGRTVHRAPRTVFCPVHGLNESYRDSFAAHAAWVSARSSFRRCDLYHVTITLREEDVRRLGLSTGDTRAVLSQLLPRLRKRLNRRDEGAEALLSMSPRPESGEYHLHVLVLSKGCTTADVWDVFALDGTDLHITTPRSREEEAGEAPMSAETFAAGVGAYLFDNRVHGAVQQAETRFSSWGKGVGYYSTCARSRRQERAKMLSEAGGDSAPAPDGSTTKNQTFGDAGSSQNGAETGEDGRETPEVAPVEVGTDTVSTAAEYRRTVMRALKDRIYSEVEVHGIGRCKLSWIEVGDEGVIICYVRPLEQHDDERRAVVWRRVKSTVTPAVDTSTDTDTPMNDTDQAAADEGDEPTDADEGDEPTATDEQTADEGDTSTAADDTPNRRWKPVAETPQYPCPADVWPRPAEVWKAAGVSMAEKFVRHARHQKSNVPTPNGRRRIVKEVDGEVVSDEKVWPSW